MWRHTRCACVTVVRTCGLTICRIAGERSGARHVLGRLRFERGKAPMGEGELEFLWVTDFPMFDDELGPDGRPQAMHHPFTMPNAEDMEACRIESDPTTVRSVAYDLVCNGWELDRQSTRLNTSH